MRFGSSASISGFGSGAGGQRRQPARAPRQNVAAVHQGRRDHVERRKQILIRRFVRRTDGLRCDRAKHRYRLRASSPLRQRVVMLLRPIRKPLPQPGGQGRLLTPDDPSRAAGANSAGQPKRVEPDSGACCDSGGKSQTVLLRRARMTTAYIRL